MTQDEIIEMARDTANHGTHASGEVIYTFYSEQLEAFANLVAAKEREACAQFAFSWNTAMTDKVAAEIRARGEQEPWCMKMNGCKTKCEDCPDKPPPTPQRTWVKLTDEEVFEICNSNYNRDSELVEITEAKLKERNT
jgi:hypothetical protein